MLNNKKRLKKKRLKNVSFILIPFFNKRVVLQSLPLNSIFLGYLLNLNTLFNTSWPSDKEELYERKFSFHHYQKSSYKFTKKNSSA